MVKISMEDRDCKLCKFANNLSSLLCWSKDRVKDLSEETGITRQTLSAWRNKQYAPRVFELERVADFFGITMDALWRGDAVNEAQEMAQAKKRAVLSV